MGKVFPADMKKVNLKLIAKKETQNFKEKKFFVLRIELIEKATLQSVSLIRSYRVFQSS